MSEIQILRRFKDQLISFIDELIDQFPEEPDFVIIRIFLKDQIPIKDVMEIFIHRILTAKEMIQNRNENFFLENSTFFKDLDSEKVNNIRKLWRGRLDKEDKIVVWQWIESFVCLGDKYQKALEEQKILC